LFLAEVPMAEKQRKLSAEDQAELEKAKATVLRLEGAPPPPDPALGPPVLRRFRIRLHGVTWDEKTKQDYDNTCRALVRDPKSGRPREVILDRAVVEAYNEADAWEKFRQAWGILRSDWTPYYVEVRDLTDGVLVGVPSPKVMPIRSDGSFNVPVPGPMTPVQG
jgi:hypothetical protein